MSDLAPLSEDELEHLIRVEASDQELRHKTYSQLRSKESRLTELIRKREAVVRAPNFSGNICALCCAAFSFFSRGKECSQCKYQVCNSCTVQNQDGIKCFICEERKDVKLRQKEWALMCPFSSVSFGIVKLFTPSHSETKTIQYPWLQRSRIENKLQTLTDCCFDDQAVNEKSYSEKIETARRDLEKMIIELFQHAAVKDRVVTSSLEQSVTEAKSVLVNSRRDGATLALSAHPIPRTYEALLSTAVMNKLTLSCVNWTIERVASIGTQTDEDTDSPRDPSNNDDVILAAEHAQNRKVPLPSIDVETDIDSALDTDEVDSLSSWGRNWFLKGKLPISPHGSVRSQCSSRVPLSFNSFLAAFEEADQSRRSSSGEDASVEDDSASGAGEALGDAPKFAVEPQSLSSESGELVTFHCQVVGTGSIDVYWYSSSKEISDQGKYRIVNRKTDHWLQIFDVEPKDSGEIVCLAVNEISVTTAIAVLRVKDCDLAGDEPSFSEELNSAVVKEGSIVKLTCKVAGYPVPRVMFHKNNVSVHDSDKTLIDRNEDGTWIITMFSSQVEDSGQYTAVAENRLGRGISRTVVSVFAKANEKPQNHSARNKKPTPSATKSKDIARGSRKKIAANQNVLPLSPPSRERNSSVASSTSC